MTKNYYRAAIERELASVNELIALTEARNATAPHAVNEGLRIAYMGVKDRLTHSLSHADDMTRLDTAIEALA